MLRSTIALGWSQSEEEDTQQSRWALYALAIYAIFSLIWAFAADAPWDDDCPTRFLNTQNAFGEPENLVSIWNRPLFVWIFALPVQLGKWVIPVLMTGIGTLAAWMLWRGLRTLQVPNAWLAIPLLAFQPFYFGTSRVALTEPLAVALICAGFLLLTRKQWYAYAIVGGLLPLARLELTVLLILWVVPLLRARQWKPLLCMAAPFLTWNLLAGIITGDFNYVFNQTIGADTGENRYGYTSFDHYFRRSMWVTGPIVFALLMQGVVARIRRKNLDLWVDGGWMLGFALYVVFSWKLSMGNAAGFLRNLVPLTPLVALIALEGYNEVMLTLRELVARPKEPTSKPWIVLAVGGGTMLLCLALFSVRLIQHQIVLPLSDYKLPVAMGGFWLAIGAAGLWMYRKASKSKSVSNGSKDKKPNVVPVQIPQWIAPATAVLALAYCLYQEPPSISDNTERQAMGIIATHYAASELSARPTYVNHNWFFWTTGNRPSDPQFQRVTMANLEKAPVGSIVIWDLHYATRLGGDVLPQYLVDRPEYVELLRIGFANRNEAVVLLEKSAPDSAAEERVSANYAANNSKFLPAILARGFRLLATQRFQDALAQFDYALGSVQYDPDLWYGRGYALLKLDRYGEAAISLQNAVALAPRFPTAWYSLGQAFSASGQPADGIMAFNKSLVYDPLSVETWYARGAAKAQMRDLQGAIADFSHVLTLSPSHVPSLRNRAAAYAMIGHSDWAIADIDMASKLQPDDLEVKFVHGRILYQIGQKEEGCRIMHEVVAAGFDKAKEFVAKVCDGAASADSTQSLNK